MSININLYANSAISGVEISFKSSRLSDDIKSVMRDLFKDIEKMFSKGICGDQSHHGKAVSDAIGGGNHHGCPTSRSGGSQSSSTWVQQEVAKGMLNSGMTKMTDQDFKDASKGICPKGMRREDFTPSFQEACRMMQENPKLKPDTADADNALRKFGGRGTPDGTVGIGDLSASLQKQPLNAEQRQTVATLRDNFKELSKGDGAFSMDALKNVAENGKMPDGRNASGALIEAARAFIADKALNFAADNAQKISEGRADQRGDQKFSKKDLDLTLAR